MTHELTPALVSSETRKDPAELETLELKGRGFEGISGDLGARCRRLRRLDLSDNAISRVDGLSAMRSLTWLSLAGNRVNALDALAPLSQLTVLNVARNGLHTLAPLGPLAPSLRALIATDNALTDTEGIGRIGAVLDTLVLSRNRIETLGAGIGNLAALRKLNVGENSLRALPPCVGELHALQELRLNGNRILRVPQGVLSRLPHLRLLDLGNNGVSDIRDLDNLSELRSLRQLNLAGNPVRKHPEYMARIAALLPRLQVLDGRKLQRGWAEQVKVGSLSKPVTVEELNAKAAAKRGHPEADAAAPTVEAVAEVEEEAPKKKKQKKKKEPTTAATATAEAPKKMASGIVSIKESKAKRSKPKGAVLKHLLSDPTSELQGW